MVTTFGRAGLDETNMLKKQTDTRNADVGFIKPFAGNTVPDGYLYCDGSAVSRTTYSELFAAIGTIYGAGDGSTTFNVPDLRGYFLRGDGGTNSAALGTAQTDAIRNLSGQFYLRGTENAGSITRPSIVSANGVFSVTSATQTKGDIWNATTAAQTSWACTLNASDSVPTAADNRPSNFSMKYCIGY